MRPALESAAIVASAQALVQQPVLQNVVTVAYGLSIIVASALVGLWPNRGGGAEPECSTENTSSKRILTSYEYAAALVWACLLGLSSSLQMETYTMLNMHSEQPLLHSVTIVVTQNLIVSMVLSISLCRKKAFRYPPLWACFSGVYTMLSFAIVVSSGAFGIATTFMALLVGSLSTALLIDIVQKPQLDWVRPCGIAVVICSVPLYFHGSHADASVQAMNRAMEVACLLLTTGAGAGVAVQALCHQKLRASLGCPFRSVLVSNVGILVGWAPLFIALGLRLEVRLEDGWLWVFCVVQNIIYLASMAVLPGLISYSSAFTFNVFGQLTSAVAIDAFWNGVPPPVEDLLWRVGGFLLALSGAAACAFGARRRDGDTA